MSQVFVVGSINVDLVGFADRLPRPGETLRGTAFDRFPGGKGANQAVAAARAGATTHMVGAVGADAFGDFMRENLDEAGVSADQVATLDSSTGVALIIVGGGENQIIVIPGANDCIDPAAVEGINFRQGDVCLAQLETRISVVKSAFQRAHERGATTIFNPAPASREARDLLKLADVLVVNETECALFTGAPFNFADPEVEVRRAAVCLALRPAQILVVTGGAEGLAAIVDGRVLVVPGHRVDVADTTGAGDCFCGFLAAGLAKRQPLETVLVEANAAAALSVEIKGAASSIPTRDRTLSFLRSQTENAQELSAPVL